LGLPHDIREAFSDKFRLNSIEMVGGGDINQARKLETTTGTFFLKFNDQPQSHPMFEAEARALESIASMGAIRVPAVILVAKYEIHAVLLLEFVDHQSPDSFFYNRFGAQLANLHLQASSDKFGLDNDNFIGPLPQKNNWRPDWTGFFRDSRLLPQIELAETKGLMTSRLRESFDRLFIRLPDLLCPSRPALLHGDLWSGNYIASDTGPCLVDPASYFGHPEMDLAMTKLFGGFDTSFYESYTAANPLESGWEERLQIYQLYYLLVHLNLFGPAYRRGISMRLDRIV
jgi:protein-ribulosamine 3-kinase